MHTDVAIVDTIMHQVFVSVVADGRVGTRGSVGILGVTVGKVGGTAGEP